MSCCACKNLKVDKRKPGVIGAKYFCKKKKKFIRGSSKICEKFTRASARDAYTRNKIFREGREFSSDKASPATYGFILIIIIVLGLILKLVTGT